MHLTGFTVLTLLSLGVAAYALAVYGFMPLGVMLVPEMREAFEAHRVITYTHVFAATLALLLGPFQFMQGLRKRHPALHRWMGRAYLGGGVLIGGIAGLAMSLHASGGVVARAGFACLAVAWLYTGLQAYRAVRAGDISRHQAWMVRNFALAFAAVMLRLYLPAAMAAGMAFDVAYPVIAWLCWIPNLVLAQWLIERADPPLSLSE